MTSTQWRTDIDMEAGVAHVTPVDDETHHEQSPDCICGPLVKYEIDLDGNPCPIYIHPSLDRRENNEPGAITKTKEH